MPAINPNANPVVGNRMRAGFKQGADLGVDFSDFRKAPVILQKLLGILALPKKRLAASFYPQKIPIELRQRLFDFRRGKDILSLGFKSPASGKNRTLLATRIFRNANRGP